MDNSKLVLLPGLYQQVKFVESRLNLNDLKILIIGSGAIPIAKHFADKNEVEVIVEDYESLMITNIELNNDSRIKVKMMDFERTDYQNESFDLIFAQGSVSDFNRKRIVKEIKRIVKKESYFCLGEVVKLHIEVPVFVKQLFENSNLDPLYKKDLVPYYTERNWELLDSLDLTFTLKEYYMLNFKLLAEQGKNLSVKEKSYYKKILNKISHESNAYLKLGANKFIGFETILLKKK